MARSKTPKRKPREVIHTDCRHYRTDRPCRPHKESGVRCPGCSHYDPLKTRVLVVKLDAIGDVLRTTCLLKPLKAKYPRAEITWLTRAASAGVLQNNPFIDRLLVLEGDALVYLQTKRFDVVVNPDTSEPSARLATLAQGKRKFGFVLDKAEHLKPLNAAAHDWYLMGLDDAKKKANPRSYQSIVMDICELPAGEHPILWSVSEEERAFAAEFLQKAGIDRRRHRVLGFNTGAGGRWTWKKWTLEGYAELARSLLAEDPGLRILLYGGPEETARNEELRRTDPSRILDAGSRNSLRQFGALVELCDVMVTGDTLGLHVATALGKKVVCLFGPTSSHEIETYGLIEKISPVGMDCLCCYLPDCTVRPACMQRIAPATVADACRRLMADVRRA